MSRNGAKNDALVKDRESAINVIPAKAGIQKCQAITGALDPGFCRGADSLRSLSPFYMTGDPMIVPHGDQRGFLLRADVFLAGTAGMKPAA